ncbi:hypothetical protein ACFQX6_45140 [Streptosporangium lutulentum]
MSLARELPGPTSPRSSGARAARTVAYPAVAGVPHPASSAEQALETALSSRDWATGRAWNQTYRSHPLANPVRLDLLWREERCVVEIDGPDHGSPSNTRRTGNGTSSSNWTVTPFCASPMSRL